jgi:hypothetical protein
MSGIIIKANPGRQSTKKTNHPRPEGGEKCENKTNDRSISPKRIAKPPRAKVSQEAHNDI